MISTQIVSTIIYLHNWLYIYIYFWGCVLVGRTDLYETVMSHAHGKRRGGCAIMWESSDISNSCWDIKAPALAVHFILTLVLNHHH